MCCLILIDLFRIQYAYNFRLVYVTNINPLFSNNNIVFNNYFIIIQTFLVTNVNFFSNNIDFFHYKVHNRIIKK